MMDSYFPKLDSTSAVTSDHHSLRYHGGLFFADRSKVVLLCYLCLMFVFLYVNLPIIQIFNTSK